MTKSPDYTRGWNDAVSAIEDALVRSAFTCGVSLGGKAIPGDAGVFLQSFLLRCAERIGSGYHKVTKVKRKAV